MFTKISVTAIVKAQLSTFRNAGTGKLHLPDVILFLILPAVASFLLVATKVVLNDGLSNALITSFSIFSALLFNLLLLIYDISSKSTAHIKGSNDPVERKRIARRHSLLKEIYTNVSFAILVATVAIVVLLISFLNIDVCELANVKTCHTTEFLPFVIYYFSIQFLLTLFMILKRVYVLLAQAFE